MFCQKIKVNYVKRRNQAIRRPSNLIFDIMLGNSSETKMLLESVLLIRSSKLLDKIEIEFFIVKRKVLSWDDSNIMSPHQAYRVQTFTPPSGKIKLNRAKTAINDFINECFNSSGKIKEKDYPALPSKWNCTFCPYKEEQELCGEGIIY